MMRYLITGGGGFIGSHLVEAALRRGRQVRVLDNFSTGRRENLRPFLADVELIEGDVRSAADVERAVSGVEVVLHQAALPSVPRSIQDPLTTNDVNVTGTLNVLHAARKAGVQRVVYASSSSVYGDTPTLPKVETMPSNPMSPYAVSKLAGEQYGKAFAQVYGLETVALRYFNIFGPRQDPTSQYSAVIPKFITQMLRSERPIIYGDGEQSRDFTYIGNAVQANLLAAEADGVGGLIANCACGATATLNQLVASLNGILGMDLVPEYTDPRSGDIRHSFADITLAKEKLEYEPEVNLLEGLERTVSFFADNIVQAHRASLSK